MILDLGAAAETGLFAGAARDAADAAASGSLNQFLALGQPARQALRKRVSELLDAKGADRKRMEEAKGKFLHRAADCVMRPEKASRAEARLVYSSSPRDRTNLAETLQGDAGHFARFLRKLLPEFQRGRLLRGNAKQIRWGTK